MNKDVIFYGIFAKFLNQVESGFVQKAGNASSNSESRILIYHPVKCSRKIMSIVHILIDATDVERKLYPTDADCYTRFLEKMIK